MKKETYLQFRKDHPTPILKHRLALHFLTDFLLWGTVAGLTFTASVGCHLLAAPLLAILMFRNFSFMHESVHSVNSKNSFLNSALGLLAGSICFLPFAPWKKVHLEHHYWSGNVEKDSVMALIDIIPRMSKGIRAALDFCWKIWFPLIALLQYTVFWVLCTKQYLKNPKSGEQLLNIVLPPAFWLTLISLMPGTFLWQSLLPGLVFYLMTVEVVNLPHHLELPQFRGDTRLPLWQQHLTSRSCVYPRWVTHLIVLNFNYHTEHHLFPDAPWYYLDKIHADLKRSLQGDLNTDPQFAWIIKNRKMPFENVLAPQPEPSQQQKGDGGEELVSA